MNPHNTQIHSHKLLRFGIVVSLCIWAVGPQILHTTQVVTYAPWFYLVAVLHVNVFLWLSRDQVCSYFSPSGLMCNYVGVSFFLGSYAFAARIIHPVANLPAYYYFQHLPLITSYFLLSMASFLFVLQVTEKWDLGRRVRQVFQLRKRRYHLLLSVAALVVFARFDLSIPPWGKGSFSMILAVWAALVITYYVSLSKNRARILVYLLLGAYFIIFNWEDKRDTVYYILVVVFVEIIHSGRFSIKLKEIISALLIVLIGIFVVAAMSVYRGYGNYQIGTMWDAIVVTPQYFLRDDAVTLVLHNLEVTSTYFHSVQAVEYIQDSQDYTWGSTFIKSLFVWLPRSLFPFKPRSLIELYNLTFYPDFRAIGGSYIPNLLAESFWNFGFWGGLIFTSSLLAIFNVIFYSFVSRMRNVTNVILVMYLGWYYYLLMLFRGSGLDMYTAYLIVYLAFGCVFLGLFSITTRPRGSKAFFHPDRSIAHLNAYSALLDQG